MKRVLAFALVACALSGAAVGAPLLGKAARPPHIFISPSGEPFRLGADDPDPLKAWFDQVDATHQGYIDRAAFRADAVRFFHRLDANSDGVIDGFEVADYENKVAPEFAEFAEGRFPGQFGPDPDGDDKGGKKGHGHGRPKPGEMIAQLIDEPEPVSGADFSLDSHITLAEWLRATDQRFDLLDTDKSGRLTLERLRARLTAPAPGRRR